MIYRAIGLMSGSSLDGLDIVFAEFHENGGKWSYEILDAECYPYPAEWVARLQSATSLSALDYQLLHAEFGHYLGTEVNRFIETKGLQYRVALIGSHGHTTFHWPQRRMTAQLGDGAALAAATQLPVVSDLRSLDVALGGQGAPIVPIGEKLLWNEYAYFLNLGGIANISSNADPYIAFDVCPANRVLNLLANEAGHPYDDNGTLAASGTVNEELLATLNALPYYKQDYPKSLANEFGTDTVYPLIKKATDDIPDSLRTYSEHIAQQVAHSLGELAANRAEAGSRLLVTGGGAFNGWVVQRLTDLLGTYRMEVIVPGKELVQYKEAVVMALMGILRWREEVNVLSSVTGAARDSIGGALWKGE